MPFCPVCRYEYEANVTECPDCEEELVASLPQPRDETIDLPSQYDDWIELARFTSQPTASMVIEALHSKDIPAVIISGTGHFGATGQMGTDSFRAVGGGFTLIVPEEFAHEADQEASIIVGDEWPRIRLIDVEP